MGYRAGANEEYRWGTRALRRGTEAFRWGAGTVAVEGLIRRGETGSVW
jgi:hypothetical protein